MPTRDISFFRSLDWWTILLYLALVVFGLFSIHAATYVDGASLFDFSRNSGKQIVWIGLSFVLVIVILLLDARVYESTAPLVYALVMLLLVATIFIGTDINGSHSWIKIGTFSIQPAEFGKFSTSLMVAWMFSNYGFRFLSAKGFMQACAVILLPVILIIAQKETGSALVYFSLILLFYRQGLSGVVLWAGLCAIVIFVVGLKYSVDLSSGEPVASLRGQEIVLGLIPLFVAAMLASFVQNVRAAALLAGVTIASFAAAWLLRTYVPLPVLQYRWVGWAVSAFAVCYTVWLYLREHIGRYLIVGAFCLIFVGFLHAENIFFEHLGKHQRARIEVLLGIREDLKGAGYNVHQAEIAIGTGGLTGKGYLEGTQTKLDYVPEQETDFIFCTVGEEEGFVGTMAVVILYGALILRLIYLAERQRTVFARVYGYCVVSIFTFHVFINVGMVIGLVPVIGIPLPFFSYGGSSLWSFTILLFILLRLDADRLLHYSEA